MTIEKRPNRTADKNAPTQAPERAPITTPGTGPKLPGPPGVPGTERFRLLAYVKQESMVRVDKRPDETVLTWPHLLRAETLAQVRPQERERPAEELERQEADANAEHAAHEGASRDLADRRPVDLAVGRGVRHRLKKSPSHGQTQFQPGPRKKEPMKVTSRPPIMMHRKKTHISLRSRAALNGVRSTYGIRISPPR